ncbi:hypothetical protein LTR08_000380 [Meristemomyces frigidus]|nr:hypothetical protein LTR08_000380 [Meristemomyces frigidus]
MLSSLLFFFSTGVLAAPHSWPTASFSPTYHNNNRTVEAFASRTYFYAGGQYVNATLPGDNTTGQYMTGQIYVEQLLPGNVQHEYPLVFIHGQGQSGTNWLNTPDGREGWASHFLRAGYIVYLTDQSQRARSPWLPTEGNLSAYSTSQIESQFTAPEKQTPLPYPQAALHTQWPGSGLAGDSVFDAFYASQMQYQTNTTLIAQHNNHSYAALLDIIGPAVVVTHSQSGAFGWQLGDARPELVKGIVALEPAGPPFENWVGKPILPGYTAPGLQRPYGVTVLPLKYDPPIGDDASLLLHTTVAAMSEDLAACERQVEPARRLVNLARVPVLVVTSEASYHAVYDDCTVAYLRQAGVNVSHVPLAEVGIHGNGHFVFSEMNNLEIADAVVAPWVAGVSPVVERRRSGGWGGRG